MNNISLLNIYKKVAKTEKGFIIFYLEEIDRIVLTKTKSVIIKNKMNENWDVSIIKRLPAKYWNYLFLCYNEIFRYYQTYQEINLFKGSLNRKLLLWIKIIPCLIDLEILRKLKKINKIQSFLIDKFNIKSINRLSFFSF